MRMTDRITHRFSPSSMLAPCCEPKDSTGRDDGSCCGEGSDDGTCC